MFETETVTTRPPACGVADIFPAESISAMIQPPKMSPLGLQSAGIARVRDASSPLGSVEFRRLSLERIPSISRLRISTVMLRCSMKLSMRLYILVFFVLRRAKFSHCLTALERRCSSCDRVAFTLLQPGPVDLQSDAAAKLLLRVIGTGKRRAHEVSCSRFRRLWLRLFQHP